MDSSSEPTSRSTTDRERTKTQRVRCFMLVTRGMRTPTELVRNLHSRNVEITTFTTPVELFADAALLHIISRMTERKDSSSPPREKPLLIIIPQPNRYPDINALINAFDKYFPKTVVLSFDDKRKPQLQRMMTDCCANTKTEAHDHNHTASPTKPSPNQAVSEMGLGNNIAEQDESAPRVIRFEEALAASQECTRENVYIPDTQEYQDDLLGDPLTSHEVVSFDPIFAPPDFSAVDEDTSDDDDENIENDSHPGLNESTTTIADDANPPGFVSEEELAMLLGDGDFLFTDSEEKSS